MPDGQSQLVANGTADGNGNVTITFPQVNVGATFSGTLSVPASELNVNWTVEVNGTPVAAITGASGYGTVQITTSDVLVITASNATPGEQYQAVLRGVLHFAGAPSLIPTPTTVAVNQVAAAPPGQIATFPATGSGSAFSESTGTIADNVRTLIVQDKVTGVPFAPGFLPNLEVTGDDSGLIYWDQPFYLANTGGAILTANVRINPAIDSSYTVAIAAVAGDTHTVTISGDSEAFDDSVFYNGTVQEVHTAVVATSQTLVAGPVRILAGDGDPHHRRGHGPPGRCVLVGDEHRDPVVPAQGDRPGRHRRPVHHHRRWSCVPHLRLPVGPVDNFGDFHRDFHRLSPCICPPWAYDGRTPYER